MTLTTTFSHSIQRVAWCAAIAQINRTHLEFWCEHKAIDPAPFDKLNSKVQSWLRGELKSRTNLERFQQNFAEWRLTVPEDDNLAYRIAEFCCAAIYSAAECVLDSDCDDISLLHANIEELYQEMDGLSDHVNELHCYWQEIHQALSDILEGSEHPPINKDFFTLLKELDTSLFGL